MKTDTKPEFGTAAEVERVCKAMQDITDKRAMDRAKINRLFNGGNPYTAEEEKKYQIQFNVNWGSGKRILEDANRQVNNALLHPGVLFVCTAEEGNVTKRDEWSQVVTQEIHRPIQRGDSGYHHNFIIKQRNASSVLHGSGTLFWSNPWSWMPKFVPIEDLLIPTDTYCDMSNLRYFAINLYLSPGEFISMTQKENKVKGWNDAAVKKIIESQIGRYTDSMPSTWRNQPEAMEEVLKQNKCYYYSDAIPKIRLRAFFFKEVDEPNRWYRHVVMREASDPSGVRPDEFIYDGSGRVFAEEIGRIINTQYADTNLVPPFKHHSSRGIGISLYAPVETLNRLQCEFVQHVFENLKMYFKIQDPADRDRLKQVVLQQYGFIPEGLSIVPQQERHMVDNNLVMTAMSQIRQIMQENSAAFIQDVEKTSGKEMTAFEARARMNQVNIMVNSMLQSMYMQEGFYYEELFRRFCEKSSPDEEVKYFQECCKKRGVPEEMLVAKKWRITPERVLGGGDRTLAQVQAQWLLDHKTMYDPSSQQRILRLATSTMLEDPAKAQNLVPSTPVTATDGAHAAENVFGTLMNGVPVSIREGIDQQGYIGAMLKMMSGVIQRIQATDNMGEIDEIAGLQIVAQNIGQHIMILSGDQTQKPFVKQAGDVLSQLMNEVKGFAQRQIESRQKEMESQQVDPSKTAEAQTKLMMAQINAQIKDRSAKLKEQHKQIGFQMDQARRNMETMAEIERENMKAHQERFNQSMSNASKTIAEVRSSKAKTIADITSMKAKNTVDNDGE